jgi:plasmid stability protein
MAQMLIRSLDDDVKARLRILAAKNGRSLEEEVRMILRQAVAEERHKKGLGAEAAALFSKNGLREEEVIPELRGEIVRPVIFD